MATTTLKDIIDRFQTVIEAAPVSLKQTDQPFGFDLQPNAALDDRYWIQDGGMLESRSMTNNAEVRMDSLTVWIATKIKFAGQTAQETMETALAVIERAIVADGPANSYAATKTERAIERIDDTDVLVGLIAFTVDYDFTLTA